MPVRIIHENQRRNNQIPAREADIGSVYSYAGDLVVRYHQCGIHDNASEGKIPFVRLESSLSNVLLNPSDPLIYIGEMTITIHGK